MMAGVLRCRSISAACTTPDKKSPTDTANTADIFFIGAFPFQSRAVRSQNHHPTDNAKSLVMFHRAAINSVCVWICCTVRLESIEVGDRIVSIAAAPMQSTCLPCPRRQEPKRTGDVYDLRRPNFTGLPCPEPW